MGKNELVDLQKIQLFSQARELQLHHTFRKRALLRWSLLKYLDAHPGVTVDALLAGSPEIVRASLDLAMLDLIHMPRVPSSDGKEIIMPFVLPATITLPKAFPVAKEVWSPALYPKPLRTCFERAEFPGRNKTLLFYDRFLPPHVFASLWGKGASDYFLRAAQSRESEHDEAPLPRLPLFGEELSSSPFFTASTGEVVVPRVLLGLIRGENDQGQMDECFFSAEPSHASKSFDVIMSLGEILENQLAQEYLGAELRLASGFVPFADSYGLSLGYALFAAIDHEMVLLDEHGYSVDSARIVFNLSLAPPWINLHVELLVKTPQGADRVFWETRFDVAPERLDPSEIFNPVRELLGEDQVEIEIKSNMLSTTWHNLGSQKIVDLGFYRAEKLLKDNKGQ